MTTPTLEINSERTYTIEEFMELPDDGNFYELVEGKLVEMQGPNMQHGVLISNLTEHLAPYIRQHRLGLLIPGTACVLDAKARIIYKPDVAFVSAERLIGVAYTDAFPKAPDLAVEVVSPSDKYEDVDDKIDNYLKAGTRLVWLIRPRRKVVEVYQQGEADLTLLKRGDELDGEDVIPGFNLKVSALFDYPFPATTNVPSANGTGM